MTKNFFIFREPPQDFAPKVEAAGCYCEFEDKILFLRRHPNKPQGNTWGIPGGKLEKTEDARAAVIREVYEEVGLKIDDDELVKLGALYIRLPELDYVFHVFRKRFLKLPAVQLGYEEHQEARWTTFSEAMQLPLIIGGGQALNYYKEFLDAK